MHRIIFAAALALSASPAFAHATLEKGEAPSGSYKAVIRIGHGCDGQSTQTLQVKIPEGFVSAKPMPKPGWELNVEKGDYAKTYKLHGSDVGTGTKTVTWTGGDLSDDFYDEFVIQGSLQAEPGAQLPFVVAQRCATASVTWDEIAKPGQDPHSLDHPAPFVTVVASDGADAHAHGGHGSHEAAEITAGDLVLSAGWARATLPGQKTGGAYVTITNKAGQADRLVSASSSASEKVEVHSMSTENDVMVMRPVEGGLEIPAGGTVELAPGGLHLMLTNVKAPFKEGETVPVTLQFEKAGSVTLDLPVQKGAGGEHQH